MRRLPLGSFLKAEYLQKSFPKFLKIDAEKLILAGNDFKELTSNAKNLAENFRDNFESHKSFAKKDKLGWRNENYGVYGKFPSRAPTHAIIPAHFVSPTLSRNGKMPGFGKPNF